MVRLVAGSGSESVAEQALIGGHRRDGGRIAFGLRRFLDTRYASLEFQSWERWVTTNGHTRIVEQSAGRGARLMKILL